MYGLLKEISHVIVTPVRILFQKSMRLDCCQNIGEQLAFALSLSEEPKRPKTLSCRSTNTA